MVFIQKCVLSSKCIGFAIPINIVPNNDVIFSYIASIESSYTLESKPLGRQLAPPQGLISTLFPLAKGIFSQFNTDSTLVPKLEQFIVSSPLYILITNK